MNETLKNPLSYIRAHAFQLGTVAVATIAALAGLLPAEAAGLMPLMLLNTGDAGAGAAAAPGAGTDAGAGDANKGAAATPGAGDSGKPAPAAAPAKDEKSSGPPRSKAAAAAERAQARLAAAKPGKPNSPLDAPAQQAKPGTEASPGEGEQAAKPGEAKPGEEKPKAGDAPPADSAKAPDNWPAERQAKFNTLPPDARSTVLDFHKDMAAGLTHAMTQLAEEKSRRQDVFALDEQFQTGAEGAKAVIAELAKRANLEIFFERPAPEDEVPEDTLKDPKKYAQYIEDRAVKRARKELATETQQRDQTTRATQARESLTRELGEAAKAHADFDTHKPAVVSLLQKAPALSVEEAYRLATYDALVTLVNGGETAKRELAGLKAEAERLKKAATLLPAGAGAGSAAPGADKFLSPGARAFSKAEAKRAAKGTPRVNA